MTYAIHEFDKWPFQMSITNNGQEIISVGRHTYSTSDSLSSVSKRPENITQYAALTTLVEKANRAEEAESRTADLQARLDAMKSEYDAATDEWYTRIERAAQLEADNAELRGQINNLIIDHETTLTRLASAEQGLANMIHEYDKAMTKLARYESVTA